MRTIRCTGLLFIFLTAQMSPGGPAPLKSGLQTLSDTLPREEKNAAGLTWDAAYLCP